MGNSLRPVECPHCMTEYLIIIPRMGSVLRVLNEINEMIKRCVTENVKPLVFVICLPAMAACLLMREMIKWDDVIRTPTRNESLAYTP